MRKGVHCAAIPVGCPLQSCAPTHSDLQFRCAVESHSEKSQIMAAWGWLWTVKGTCPSQGRRQSASCTASDHWTLLLRFLTPAPTHDRNMVWLSRSGRTLRVRGVQGEAGGDVDRGGYHSRDGSQQGAATNAKPACTSQQGGFFPRGPESEARWGPPWRESCRPCLNWTLKNSRMWRSVSTACGVSGPSRTCKACQAGLRLGPGRHGAAGRRARLHASWPGRG